MPLCANCGKDNREGSRFCQSCGTPLAAAAPAKTQTQAKKKKSTSEVAVGATCVSCGTLNAPGMRFCKMCGAPLDTPAGQPAKIRCPSCGGSTPSGFKFCQHCGTPLGKAAPAEAAPAPAAAEPAEAAPAPAAAEPAVPKTQYSAPTGSGPTGLPKTIIDAEPPAHMAAMAATPPPVGAPPPAAVQAAAAAQAQAAVPSPAPAAPPVATPPAGVPAGSPAAAAPPVEVQPAAAPASEAPDKARSTIGPGARVSAPPAVEPKVLARLVAVNRDGTDGATYSIEEEAVDLGRAEGQFRFPDDPYLADRHCRLFIKNGAWIVQDLNITNGVYLRLHDPWELGHGDRLLLGKQVLCFEFLSDQERDLSPAVEQGVLVFGSPLRVPWSRLRQMTVAGIARDVYHLYRAKVTIGREDGDIIFPDDEFMSRRHLCIALVGGKAKIEDLGSSNGTYVRIRGQRELRTGDMVRVGDQLLRFEQA